MHSATEEVDCPDHITVSAETTLPAGIDPAAWFVPTAALWTGLTRIVLFDQDHGHAFGLGLVGEIVSQLAMAPGRKLLIERPAFVGLIGDEGFIQAEDFQLGLFLIAPKTLYRDHFHPAPELYVPLTGPHEWRFGTGESWKEYNSHIPVWNEPMQVHATLVRDRPFLSLYAWTKDVEGISVVAPAPDWAEIEASL